MIEDDEDFLGEMFARLIREENSFANNPGAVPGVNQFTIQPSESKEALNMNAHISELLILAYENVPPRSAASLYREMSLKMIEIISLKIKSFFEYGVTERVSPLVVIDGSPEEGGKEATTYLAILQIVHDKYISLHRQFMYTVKGGSLEQQKAEEQSHRTLWNIRSLISRGVMGKKISIEEIKKRGRFYKKNPLEGEECEGCSDVCACATECNCVPCEGCGACMCCCEC
jgi:hypothetical protein